ncbi:hypothetical protein GP486_004895 [Trichoglossum hirsutum]|uniref:Uncharacterized protein n=1 Tax=Trichoglossum hirsutum TaxID=265104 RepID=A0A9P8LA97_9PEZI|nr:hypothetical protein GP486_004895 [Trichoglossum hirsutum]
MAREQLLWLIKKGDLILSNEPKVAQQRFTRNFYENGSRKGKIIIYAYDDDDIPERLYNSESDLTVVHTLEYDLTEIPLQEFVRREPLGGGRPFYVAYLTLTMKMDTRHLKIELCWKNKPLCSLNLNYLSPE